MPPEVFMGDNEFIFLFSWIFPILSIDFVCCSNRLGWKGEKWAIEGSLEEELGWGRGRTEAAASGKSIARREDGQFHHWPKARTRERALPLLDDDD